MSSAYTTRKPWRPGFPAPDFFVNNYAGCSTGQQWDGISFRVFGKSVPLFTISHPFLWGNKPDAGYLTGEEWHDASQFVASQLRQLIVFLEERTGRPFDWDALSESMTYIKRAAELRCEGLELCKAKPAPATFWDWIACVAPINFLPGDQALVDYFGAVRDEIADRLAQGISGVQNERYRLYFDGIMNWNKLGFLSRKFAEHGAAVLAGRYIQNAFWQEPDLIDPDDPLLGMAQHYLLCPTNHGTKTLDYLTIRDCRDYGDRRPRLPFHADLSRVHGAAKAAGPLRSAEARNPVDLLRRRRRRCLLLQGGDPGEPAGRHVGGHRHPAGARR